MHMFCRGLTKLGILTVLFIAWINCAIGQGVDQQPIRNLLIIYGFSEVGGWDQEFNSRIRTYLDPDTGIYAIPEFLSLTAASASELELIADSLALRHSNKDIWMIVPVMPEANAFVRDWSHVFAPDAQIINVMPSDEFIAQASSDPTSLIVGSEVETAIEGTVALLPILFPDLENIYVTGGASGRDLIYTNRFRELLPELGLPYQISYLSGLPTDELIQVLSEVPENSVAMTTTYSIDSLGRPLSAIQVLDRLSSELAIPVFSINDRAMQAGAFGGRITTIESYAQTTARLITEAASGLEISTPISSETELVFNGEQLDRFDIDRSLLPVGSVIINDAPNLWRDYGNWLVIGAIIIVIQTALIAALLEARRRRHIAEESLGRALKMEALGSLAGGIAHDFNNILMSITGNTELIAHRFPQDELTQGQIASILTASERAKKIISQILMFSRHSNQSKQETINVLQLAQESAEQIRAFLPDTCEISVSGKDVPAILVGDAVQLYQVIMNLCVNAQQAIVGKGQIYISIDTVEFLRPKLLMDQSAPAGQYVTISVKDTGSGISKDALHKVFEPFFTTKPVGSGTGLGLSLVYQIVKSNNGFIDVETAQGEGTKFVVYMPVSSDLKVVEGRDESHQIVYGNNERILLVDDDMLLLDTYKEIFKNLKYSTVEFSSSVAALNEFVKEKDAYDLVFTDLSMPEMDGVRLITKIRQYVSDIPVILCTGYLDSIGQSEIRDVHIIQKPSTATEISIALRNELDRKGQNSVTIAHHNNLKNGTK
ncbi:MAG: response regulator [Pseudomonadales bacterium]|nr:response regulator [Pseudomonadales bacterium]